MFEPQTAVEVAMNFSWARVAICTVLVVTGIYVGAIFARFMRPDDGIVAGKSSSTRMEIQLPDPRLSPAEVVRMQVDALREFQNDSAAINQCYALASPANRAVTGPLDRFTAMVQNPTYRALVMQTSALVGESEIRDDLATVLVTVLDPSRMAHVYRFFLSKQTEPPFLDCWMTDSVFPERGQIQPPQELAPMPRPAA